MLARLSTKSTMLRESCDPSMLLQAIIDIIVDQAQPIITAYRRRFTELEVDAMVTPTMAHTQDLHLMAAELSLLSNTIMPISTLVQSLRDHTAAAVAHKGTTKIMAMLIMVTKQTRRLAQPLMLWRLLARSPPQGAKRSPSRYALGKSSDAQVNVRDFIAAGLSQAPKNPATSNSNPSMVGITPLTKLYFGDISDHLFSYMQDLDMMRKTPKT